MKRCRPLYHKNKFNNCSKQKTEITSVEVTDNNRTVALVGNSRRCKCTLLFFYDTFHKDTKEITMTRLDDIIAPEMQEDLIQLGFRMDGPAIDIENDHDMIMVDKEIQLVSVRTFTRALSVRNVDGKDHIYCAGDKITMRRDGNGRITMYLQGIALKGRKRHAVIVKMMEHSRYILDHFIPMHLGTVVEDEWAWYRFMWNGKVLQAAVMVGSPVACALRIYTPRSDGPTAKEYYDAWYKKSSTHTYSHMRPREVSDIYGEPESSGFTQDMHDQLDEMIDVIASVVGVGEYDDELDAIAELVCSNMHAENMRLEREVAALTAKLKESER